MSRKFTCKFCEITFSPEYRLPQKRKLHFCSKSCKSKFQKQGYFNKTQLENSIRALIRQSGRYLTKNEILDSLGISSKTLSKFRISTLSLNRGLKMKKPKSIFEHKVGIFLIEVYPDLLFEQTFENCLSNKGFLLKFDFYSPSQNLLIEADGSQHGNLEHYFFNLETLSNDKIKTEWTKANGYSLIRIPYTRKVTKEYIQSILRKP